MPTVQVEVFLDTAYAVALSAPNDQFHDRAALLAVQLEAEKPRLVTTEAVVLEIVPLSAELCVRAFQLYSERTDKEWGLTDCVSFMVMSDRRIGEALTPDEHFRQAGFRPLLQ